MKTSRAPALRRDEAICFVAPPVRWSHIASSSRLAAGLFALTTRGALDVFTASEEHIEQRSERREEPSEGRE